jgi:hypothetical protein
MKFLTKILLTFTLISPTFADDAVIVKSSSHYSSWQSRLEADSHNVTVGTSLPSNVSSYEMLIDFRYTTAISSSDETAMETVLTNDGTVVLIGENSNFATRNNSIQALLRQWTGDNTITYHATQYIGYDGDDEQLSDTNVLSSLPGDWSYLNFAAGGVITDLGDDGEYIAKNSDGQIGVAMWRGTALTANYQGGVVIVITDVNHASGSYYTADNTEFIDSLINDLIQQNATNRSVSSSVSITSAQTTIKNAAIAATNTNLVYIEQTGAGSIIDVFQDGEDNFIVDTDWSGPAVLNGSNQILDVDQLTSDNGIALGMVGNNIEVTAQGTSGTNGGHKAIIDIDAASNVVGLTQYDGGTLSQHFALIDVDGASNNIQVMQRDNGQKILFMDVDIISGDIDIMQKDTGSHYLELNLTGSASHDVDIMQQGTGDHAARVSLGGGYATDFNLNQQGSTDQSYELNSTCSDALGCSVSVTQGN